MVTKSVFSLVATDRQIWYWNLLNLEEKDVTIPVKIFSSFWN